MGVSDWQKKAIISRLSEVAQTTLLLSTKWKIHLLTPFCSAMKFLKSLLIWFVSLENEGGHAFKRLRK